MGTTIKDVARAAGVSHSTVSRALNGRAHVSSRCRRRVETAARALGYRVNVLARGLACNRTQTLGLLLPISLNPFFAQMAQAIVHEARRHAHAVILDMFDFERHDELEHLEILRERRVDGVLVGFDTFAPSGKDYLLELQRRDFPLVVMSAGSASDLAFDRVAADDQAGGYAVTRHLLELGHRRIALVLDRPDLHFLMSHRVRGYEQALADAGAEVRPELVVAGAETPESTRRVTLSLMREHRPTAIFGCNDYTAIVVQHSLLEAGLRVPQDVSVVGFDGIELGALVAPPLTTVAYPWRAVARSAIGLLLELIEAGAEGDGTRERLACRQVIFPYDLVVRKSASPPVDGRCNEP